MKQLLQSLSHCHRFILVFGAKRIPRAIWLCALLVVTVTSMGCHRQARLSSESQSLTPASTAIVEDGVRGFMQAVAHDVTVDGPAAWRKEFADSPSFFMAADGQMVFPDNAAATKGIQDLALDIKQIELVWGNDLRVDPLMPDLAGVAVSYHEVRVNTIGLRVEDAGFFTGIAEYRMAAGNYAMPIGRLPHLLVPRLSRSQDEVTGNWKLLCNRA
jgi:hypothetical protein